MMLKGAKVLSTFKGYSASIFFVYNILQYQQEPTNIFVYTKIEIEKWNPNNTVDSGTITLP